MNRLFAIAKEPQSYREIFKNYLDDDGHFCEKKVRVNKNWAKVYKLQLDYLLGFEKSSILSPITCLFDEIDKSLDIVNIHTLYTTILPDLVKNTGIQIIIVSHSPLVLSDAIRNNEMYNFISLDEEYTQDCLNKIGNLFGTDYAK